MAEERRKSIDAIRAEIPPADTAGSLSAFDCGLFELPAMLWTGYSEKLMRAAAGGDKQSTEAASLLEDAAAFYAYHAGHTVLSSDRFRQAACVSTAAEADILNAAFCLAAAWGWADAEIVSLQPGQGMMVRARTYAEAETTSSVPSAHFFRGICRAYMDLAYGGPFPGGLGAFACRQTFGVEAGDPYGEFIVTKAGQ